MPEAKVTPLDAEQTIIRYDRSSWIQAGTDDFTLPPAQNPDMFLQLNNILPPATNVLLRRFGYRFFDPSLDTGPYGSDEAVGGPFTYSPGYFNYTVSNTFSNESSVPFTYQPSFPSWNSGISWGTGIVPSIIADSNNNVERCVVGGMGHVGSAPTWATSPIGAITSDGSGSPVEWYLVKYGVTKGDMIIAYITSAPHGTTGTVTVSGVTDSNGNTWTPLAPTQSYQIGSMTFLAQNAWCTFSNADIPYGTALTITANFTSAADSVIVFAQFSNLLPRVQPVAQGNFTGVTSWSSGSQSIDSHTALITLSGAGLTETVSAPFTFVAGFSGAGNIQIGFYAPGISGTYPDAWTSGTACNAVSSLIALPLALLP